MQNLLNPGITIPIGDGFTIYYYAIIIVFGIICAAVVAGILFKHRNLPADWILDLLLCVLPLGIIGARTFYCLTDPSTSIADWFTKFRAGGLSIIGGVIGGTLGVVLFCLIHKLNFLRVADCVVPGVILAQAIGRWGNFANQEVYGPEITNPALQWFPMGVFIDDVQEWHYAFFFYESVLNLLIFIGLFLLMWKFTKKPHGLALSGYLFGYGVVRSIMEPLRDSQFILGSSLPISQVFALCMAIGGAVLFVAILLVNKKLHGSFFGAAEGEPSAILPRYYSAEERKKMEEEKRKKLSAANANKAEPSQKEKDVTNKSEQDQGEE